MTKTIELTKQIVAIPSWVGPTCNEIKLGQFIYDWLRKNTKLKVIKQPVKDGRFNVIAMDNYPTTLLLNGHIDTVEPGTGWNTDPFTPCIIGDRLYGRGTTDMKGSLAAMLNAVSEVKDTKGLMILCYIDEEYDFAGMLAFVQKYKNILKPKLIVSLDGSAGQIGIGCRGLIELSYKIRGTTGHAGRPSAGKNAIRLGTKIIDKLEIELSKFSDPILGISTCNLAYLNGGLDLGNNRVSRQGNNIANIAEFVVDIRTSLPILDAKWVSEKINQFATELGVVAEDFQIRHNLGSWLTNQSDLKKLGISERYEASLGYIDTQMLWETFDKVPCCTIGAGNLGLAHKPNEFVETKSLENTCQNLKIIINNFAIA